ncbi:ABC transporter ATP-binding protein [Limnoglobus roseus]|uniref:ABC transporter ATP-binding protein n=1 Tax=Limnoglobus roseus TaxID=2598579 RepID=A0A5C1AC85_9BACT|nr:ABC transporter ATP-binding protein [Limnoglobus roseus]QEL16340.1 ABC transporter ATP-binding protein [Limnoglobus roseus]
MSFAAGGVSVEAVGVRRAFGPHVVLDRLNLRVAAGEFVAIVGRSGSGKSTLLRLLAGLDQPTAGEVRIDGRPLAGLSPRTRVLFQDGRLLPWLRVGENVALGLDDRRRENAARLLERVGLATRAADYPGVLSGGQRQRVALARALAAEPGFLLFDEPLGSLDALTRVEMQRLVEELWRERPFTGVLITHDVAEAVTLADRVLLLEGGGIRAEWPVPFPRPRATGSPDFARLVEGVLGRVLGRPAQMT